MMAKEKETVDVGAAVEAAKHTVGSVKLSQGLLSFRSRKLLRSSLSKSSDTKNVDKRAVSLPTTQVSNLERSKTASNEAHVLPTKARRMLWDPRKVESDAAKTTTRSSTRQSKNLEPIPPIKDEQLNDGSAQSDRFVEAPPTQQLSPKFKLLEVFYEGLEAACSLLRIRKQMCTFRAVCKIVESMSRRRFMLKHLAEIKHIFSEVIQLEYVRCQDPDSWGERWDMRITLLPLPSDCPHTSSPLKGSAGQTAQAVRRRKEFHARLLCFASSHPEDVDIPLGVLPRRPVGGESLLSSSTQRAASPPSYRMSDSHLSAQVASSEASTEPANAEPPVQIGTEEVQFSIVKPSRSSDTVPVAGTPHFLASFRPFYSNIRTDEKVVPPLRTVAQESHFPVSFRPSFSARRTSEGTGGLPMQFPDKVLSDETLLNVSCCEDKDGGSGVETRIGSEAGISCSVSANSSSLSDNGFQFPPSTPIPPAISEELPPRNTDKYCHFTPSTPVPSANSKELSSSSTDQGIHFAPSTPVPSANSKELPSCSIAKSCPQSQHGAFPVSPIPIHTPPFVSPMNRMFSSNQDSPKETPCKMLPTDSLRDPLPLKSQGIMRSLRFGSPVRAAPQQKGEDPEISRITHSLTSAVDTHPSDASSVRFGHPSVSSPCTPAPETPNLLSPVRTTQSKEAWYSPPKRMKLRASLFTNDRDKHQETSISGPSIACAEKSCPDSVGGGQVGEVFSNGPLQEASEALIPCPTPKDGEGITESDLDVIECLPQDIVQSVWEKERKMKDTSSRELAKLRRRQQMLGGVPKLFNQLRLIFQSLNRTVLPEHELIKTILTSHPEVTDKVEVVERLKLVIELAPDYIHTRPSHSGELLYRLEHASQPSLWHPFSQGTDINRNENDCSCVQPAVIKPEVYMVKSEVRVYFCRHNIF